MAASIAFNHICPLKKHGLNLASEGGKYSVHYSEVLSSYSHIPHCLCCLFKATVDNKPNFSVINQIRQRSLIERSAQNRLCVSSPVSRLQSRASLTTEVCAN